MAAIILGSLYKLGDNFASGSYGEIFRATNIETGQVVAIKVEKKAGPRNLLKEYNVYQILQGGVGVSNVYLYGTEPDCNFLVMDLLGRSLDGLFELRKKVFTLKTVLMLADQMISRIEYVHGKDYIHGDIKPGNFVMGIGEHKDKVFILDFGFSKRFRDPLTNTHISWSHRNKLSGTSLYASINNHSGAEQSRRDDLESLGYMLMYFNLGSLPWQGFKAATKKELNELIREKKMSLSLEELCKNVPAAFLNYLTYTRQLNFDEDPNYGYCRRLFNVLFNECKFKHDLAYDWKIPHPNTSQTQPQQNFQPVEVPRAPVGSNNRDTIE